MAKFTIYNSKICEVGNLNADSYQAAYDEMKKRGICTWRNFVVKDGDDKFDAMYITPDTLKHNPR